MNAWCEALGIEVPRLEAVVGHSEANNYGLLIVALLESGEPMTLAQVAVRFAEAGVTTTADRALRSLKRCKPARRPVFRQGDDYELDPHDEDLGFWTYRLDLRPPAARAPAEVVEEPALPGPEVPLTELELQDAWRDARLGTAWSKQRIVLAVLDATGRGRRKARRPNEVVAHVDALASWHPLNTDVPYFRSKASAVQETADGDWAIGDDTERALLSAREAVRAETARTRAKRRRAARVEAYSTAWAARQLAERAELAAMRRGLLYALGAGTPRAVALLDVEGRELETFIGDEVTMVAARLDGFDIIGAMGVRELLTGLGVESRGRRLAELGPARKSRRLNRAGRTLKITTELLIGGSCGISKPLGDPAKMAEYLSNGEHGELRRRLEANVKSLYALYEYGRLHGWVRLRWGFLDEMVEAPWRYGAELSLPELMRQAAESSCPLELVVGSAPGWSAPWSRAIRATVRKTEHRGWLALYDEAGDSVDEADVQRARLVVP